MKTLEHLKQLADHLPMPVRRSIQGIPDARRERLQEIRLRAGRPVAVNEAGRIGLLTAAGELTNDPDAALRTTTAELDRCFQSVMNWSVYSHEHDVAEGFVTLRGGCRVGLAGTAAHQGRGVQGIRQISSLCFRIAGEWPGTAARVWNETGGAGGILVVGPVGSGKTSYLRDLCRLSGNARPTALVDERGEIGAVWRGIPQNDVGIMTDVLDGYPRAEGIVQALRVLAPTTLVCDEIATDADADAILLAAGCGVRMLASAHAGSIEELLHRRVLAPLLEADVFRWAVLLGGSGRVQTVRRLRPA